VLGALVATDPALAPLLETIDHARRSRAWNDAKLGAHHGIIPTTEPVALSKMSEDERTVYQLIRAHYLAQFLPSHEYDRTVARLTCGTEVLEAHGKRTRIIGWRSVVEAAEVSEEDAADDSRSQALPALRPGTTCALADVQVKALKTRAPRPYTQGELIQAMKGVSRFVSNPRLKQKLKDTAGLGTEGISYRSVERFALPRQRSCLSMRCPKPSPIQERLPFGSRRSSGSRPENYRSRSSSRSSRPG